MTVLATKTTRLKVDLSRETNLLTQANRTPEIWRGTDWQLQLGVFQGDTPYDLSQVESLTVEIRDNSNRTAAAYVSKTVAAADITNTITLENWTSGAAQHCSVDFTDEETSLDLGGNEKVYLLAIGVIATDGKRTTLGTTILKVKEDGLGSESPGGATFLTEAQSDARYVPRVQVAGEAVRFKTGEGLQLQDRITGKWTTIYFEDGAFAHGPWEDE